METVSGSANLTRNSSGGSYGNQRQTDLRDRYLHPDNGLPRSYPAGAR